VKFKDKYKFVPFNDDFVCEMGKDRKAIKECEEEDEVESKGRISILVHGNWQEKRGFLLSHM
jgi:hypothetical protein